MIELIERLEKATGPDEALDGLIAMAIGYGVHDATFTHGYRPIPRYTGSTDAALTLKPPGFAFEVIFHGDGGCSVSGPWPSGGTLGLSSVPAIALCIAALRARTAMKTGQALAASESVASPLTPPAHEG